VPDRVLCSTARRARETWQLVGEKLGAHPQTIFEDRVYEASIVDLLDLVRQTPTDVGTLLVVGHDPATRAGTLELASAQPSDKEAKLLGAVRVKYPTAAIAVLSFSGSWADLSPGEAHLDDFVVPGDLHGNRR
jgi:phosphohistidine phosphatase